MALKANIYPAKWQFSNDCPAPPPGTWVDPSVKVAAFLSISLCPHFFDRIVVWERGRQYLSNYRAYKIDGKTGCRVITVLQKAIEIRRVIADSCEGSGHMSVLFVPKHISEFSCLLKELDHYGEPQLTEIGTSDSEKKLYGSGMEFANFLESSLFHKGDHIFTFTHDAEYLLEIFR